MGRYATVVPTEDNVANAIRRLKDSKRAEWRLLAEQQGWTFEEYVIARIRRNIKYRRRRVENHGQILGRSPEPGTTHTERALDTACIQEQDAALSGEKRRRCGSWIDSPAKRSALSAPPQRHTPTQLQGNLLDLPPAGGSTSRHWTQRTDSFLAPDVLQSRYTPPSGGAASRADTSFARTTSFVTATEGDDDVTSIASSNLPSPILTFAPNSPAVDDSQYSGPDTQAWRDFLDSTQGRTADEPPTSTIPRTSQPSSSPVSAVSDPRASFPEPRARARTGESLPERRLTWVLKAENVPPAARRLWCVRKGLVPGFHFDEPWMPPLSQSRAFHEMRFETFDINPETIEETILRANRYMNHQPIECIAEYIMCHLDCKRLVRPKREPLAPRKSTTLPQNADREPYPDIVSRCRRCGHRLQRTKALLCESCAYGPSADSDIAFCVRMFDLAEEQTSVLREAARGQNIFFTGAAGTGKSTTLRALVRYLHRKKVGVEVVSPTGIAALNVGGRTLHMFAGWTAKADRKPLDQLRRIACGSKNCKRLTRPGVLIIDEISMISNFTLSRLDAVMRAARRTDQPFGGTQIVVSGDFHQLGPVKAFKTCLTCGRTMQNPKKGSYFECVDHPSIHRDQQWAFCSPTWDACNFRYIQLKKIHRQQDPAFSELLNKIRIGAELTERETARLTHSRSKAHFEDATKIYPFRSKVTEINETALAGIKHEKVHFRCLDDFWWNRHLHPELKGRFDRVDSNDEFSGLRAYEGSEDRHRFDNGFHVKLGMPVILLKNLSPKDGLVNGARGVVVGYEQYGHPNAAIPHIATRIKANYDLSEWSLFGEHAGYQLHEILTFIDRASDKRWPIVRFDNGVRCTIRPHCEVEELGFVPEDSADQRFSLMSRTQIPLVAGWAITTHKSQGMTLDKAVVDLCGSWQPGQPYTALSRVRSLDGLWVKNLASGKGMEADSTVVAFMAKHFD